MLMRLPQGIDASICPGLDTPPMPDAFELLGIGRFGGAGTTAVAALVTGVLKALPLRLCGYTGLMLPVCEDAGLAARAQHVRKSVRRIAQHPEAGNHIAQCQPDCSVRMIARKACLL